MTDPRFASQIRLEREMDPTASAAVLEIRAAGRLATYGPGHDPDARLMKARSRHIDEGVSAAVNKRAAERKALVAEHIAAAEAGSTGGELDRTAIVSAAIEAASAARPDLYSSDNGKAEDSPLRQRVIGDLHRSSPWLFESPPPEPVRLEPSRSRSVEAHDSLADDSAWLDHERARFRGTSVEFERAERGINEGARAKALAVIRKHGRAAMRAGFDRTLQQTAARARRAAGDVQSPSNPELAAMLSVWRDIFGKPEATAAEILDLIKANSAVIKPLFSKTPDTVEQDAHDQQAQASRPKRPAARVGGAR